MRPLLPLLAALAVAVATAEPLGGCCEPGARYHDDIWACVPDNDTANTTDAYDWELSGGNATVETTTEVEEKGTELPTYNQSSSEALTWGDDQRDDSAWTPEQCTQALVDVPAEEPYPRNQGLCLADDGVVRACVDAEQYCATHYCVPKCCQHGYSMENGKKCVPSSRGLPLSGNLSLPADALDSGVALVAAALRCSKYPLDPVKRPVGDARWLERDDSTPGLLAVVVPNYGERHVLGGYCLEFVHVPPGMHGIYVFVCFPPTTEVQLKHVLEAVGLFVSVACLAFTLAVYACLPTLQNLHGRILMCHIAALFAAYIALAILKVVRKLTEPLCVTFGVVALFFLLAAFSWLTVMCFDIWWTFGAVRSSRESSRRSRSRRLFALYSLYAWGVPTVVTTVAWYLRAHGRILGLGKDSCFIKQYTVSYTEVITAPVGAQLLVNVVLFALTARCCWRVKAELERMAPAAPTKRKYRADLAKVVMNAKLFVVMGLTFTLEVVSGQLEETPTWLWYLPDAVNVLQGVLISAIFVLKQRVLRALARRLGLSWGGAADTGVNTPPSASAASRNVRARSLTPGARDLPIALKSTPSNTTLFTTISANGHTVNNNHHGPHSPFVTTKT